MTRGYKLNTVEQAHDGVALIYRLDAEAELFKVLNATENIANHGNGYLQPLINNAI